MKGLIIFVIGILIGSSMLTLATEYNIDMISATEGILKIGKDTFRKVIMSEVQDIKKIEKEKEKIDKKIKDIKDANDEQCSDLSMSELIMICQTTIPEYDYNHLVEESNVLDKKIKDFKK